MGGDETTLAYATALGLGLMIGVVRERRHDPAYSTAGTRTHALVALLGCVAWGLGVVPFTAALVVVGALAIAGYLRSVDQDPGQTGEVTLILTLTLAALARKDPPTAAALGVLCAILLHAKQRLHQLSREWISEQELQDGLLLAAAALVVMPLLPHEAVDPWGVLRPTTLWRIVVLVMAVGMFGHFAQRAIGARWGLPIAGFFSGFASSTATVAGFGRRVAAEPTLLAPACAAALLANLASLLLLVGVIAASSSELLASVRAALGAAGVGLVVVTALCLRRFDPAHAEAAKGEERAFHVGYALAIAALIAAVSLLSAWLSALFGDAGALTAAVLVALAEVHAAAASVGQLHAAGDMGLVVARWGVLGVLAASALAKTVLAYATGGARYGHIMGAGLGAMLGGAALVMVAGY